MAQENDEPPADKVLAELESSYDIGDTGVDVPDDDTIPKKPADAERDEDEVDAEEGDEEEAEAKPKHTARRLSRALSVGISVAEANTVDADTLDDVIFDRLRNRPDNPKAEPEEESPVDIGLNEEDWNPELLKAIKGVKKAGDDKYAKLEQEFRAMKVATETERQVRLNRTIDKTFALINNEKAFGKGGVEEIRKQPDAMERRMAVLIVAEKDKSSHPISVKIKNAAERLFGGGEPAGPSKEVKRWRRGGLQKPTRRDGKPERPGVGKAARNLAKMMGVPLAAGNDSEDFTP